MFLPITNHSKYSMSSCVLMYTESPQICLICGNPSNELKYFWDNLYTMYTCVFMLYNANKMISSDKTSDIQIILATLYCPIFDNVLFTALNHIIILNFVECIVPNK